MLSLTYYSISFSNCAACSPSKVLKGRSLWGKLGMTVFFARYKVLEQTNFPILTWGNFFALLLIPPGIYLFFQLPLTGLGMAFVIVSAFLMFLFTFVFTAPTISRITIIRRCYLIFVHHLLCRAMESIAWCTGTNRTGYIMHSTAHKLLAYHYVTAEEMEQVCSLAIVRNPYARMVSLYHYNRFGRWESFQHFVKDWHKRVFRPYRDNGELEEWYTPCHAIPMFEFTHFDGKQVVRSIVKQEELKYLKTVEGTPVAVAQDSTVADLPDIVRKALLGMPHTNQRKTAMKWYEYYDQRTLDLVHEMYAKDFVVFEYNPVLEQRPDLNEPRQYRLEQQHLEHLMRDSWSSSGNGERQKSIEKSVQSPVSHVTIRRHFQSSMTGTRLFDLEEGEKEDEHSNPATPERAMHPVFYGDDEEAEDDDNIFRCNNNNLNTSAVVTPDSSTSKASSS